MAEPNSSIKFISNAEISTLLTWDAVLSAVEDALRRYSKRDDGDIIQPIRTTFKNPHNSTFFAMPCYIGKEDMFCTKLLTLKPDNRKLGIPTHQAVIVLFDGKTGRPQALLDADVLTAMRTAAASAVATKYLVNGSPNNLAILGAGTQARSHFQALSSLYTFSAVKIWNIRPESGRKFVEELQSSGANATLHNTVEEAVADADIICVVNGTTTPILDASWVKRGAHINGIGANHPTHQEIHLNLMRNSVVYVDCEKAALKESGDIIQSKVEIYGEIGEVLLQQKLALKENTTIFKSTGLAVEDAVVANIVYQKAVKVQGAM